MTFDFISLFTGIGGLDLAMEAIGGNCIIQVEKDKNCLAVLRKRFPNTLKITNIYDAHRLPRTKWLVFGSPCQNLSVAGDGSGLFGVESSLFFEAHRIIRESLPGGCLFENVFGLLSSHGGRDFAIVLGAFTGTLPQVPREGWGNAGFMRGRDAECYCVAWRVLDAKHFGVPQRRRRVVIVATLGNGRCAEILFEPSSMSWDPPAREGSKEDTAATLGACSSSGGGKRTTDLDGVGAYVVGVTGRAGEPERIAACPPLAPTLCAQGKGAGSTTGRAGESGHLIAEVFNAEGTPGANLTASNGSHQANNQAPLVVETFHVGFNDAGGKRQDRPEGGAYLFQTDIAPAVTTNGDSPIKIVEAVFSCNSRQDPVPSENLVSGVDGRPQCTPVVAYPIQDARGMNKCQNGLGIGAPGDPSYTLDTTGTAGVGVGDGLLWRVRRLTPLEYERLQCFPEVEIKVWIHEQPAGADAPRTKRQSSVGSVENAELPLTAKCAEQNSPQNDQKGSAHALPVVLIKLEESRFQLHFQGRCIFSASTAETRASFPHQATPADFAAAVAGIVTTAERTIPAGSVESRQSERNSIHPERGEEQSKGFGSETMPNVSGASSGTPTTRKPTTCITLSHSSAESCARELQICFSFVRHAITGFTPVEMPLGSFCIEIARSWGWTKTGINEKGRPITIKDGPRYRMTGNSVAWWTFLWVARRIEHFSP